MGVTTCDVEVGPVRCVMWKSQIFKVFQGGNQDKQNQTPTMTNTSLGWWLIHQSDWLAGWLVGWLGWLLLGLLRSRTQPSSKHPLITYCCKPTSQLDKQPSSNPANQELANQRTNQPMSQATGHPWPSQSPTGPTVHAEAACPRGSCLSRVIVVSA